MTLLLRLIYASAFKGSTSVLNAQKPPIDRERENCVQGFRATELQQKKAEKERERERESCSA